ncbi:Pathogenesis-related transcriptional factor and ERF protein [Flammeovirgaceae bacterium SG7u.111]|nr:Pathogenesis-related transcriptional factor and ERF protein [Flammeovirgaceae bacterium SG7u.132]WPO35822.1 Pathogenesis-related transcriptional factor and ERF protein [Flammeovirgaceae bacterium SG7u.111]
MLYKVKLKNADDYVVISGEAYEFIEQNEYYKTIGLLDNLRMHSSGYVFFQRNFPYKDGYKNLTIYLHKLIAEKFIPKPESEKRLFVRIMNSNPLDCRLKNLEWATMSELRRNQRKHNNKTGYRGVVKVSKNTFRAVLYDSKTRYDLGLFKTAEEAAEAYNKKSEELFGKTKSLNRFGDEDDEELANAEIKTKD